MVIVIILDMNIIQQYNSTSSIIQHHGHFFSLKKTVDYINCNRNKKKHIPHAGLCLFTDIDF